MSLSARGDKGKKGGRLVWVGVISGLYFVVSLWRGLWSFSGVGDRVVKMEQDVEKLKQENQRLKAEAERVASEDYVELSIRDELGLVASGEAVVVLPEEYLRSGEVKDIPEVEEVLKANWKKWVELFF